MQAIKYYWFLIDLFQIKNGVGRNIKFLVNSYFLLINNLQFNLIVKMNFISRNNNQLIFLLYNRR